MGVITYVLYVLMSSLIDKISNRTNRLCGYAPFYGKTEKLLYDRIKTGTFDFEEDPWPNLSLEVKDFISKLLVVDPVHRMSASEALEHPWIVSIPAEYERCTDYCTNRKTTTASVKKANRSNHNLPQSLLAKPIPIVRCYLTSGDITCLICKYNFINKSCSSLL